MAKVQRLQYGVDRIEDGGWVVLEDGDERDVQQAMQVEVDRLPRTGPSRMRERGLMVAPESRHAKTTVEADRVTSETTPILLVAV